MGDRVNIVVQGYEGSRVYLYSHWDGERVLKSAVKGLKSGRVTDAQYLPRIIFQDMLGSDDGETGYGISSVIGDNQYPILVIDAESMNPSVHFEKEDKTPLTKPMPYQEFLALVEADPIWADDENLYGIFDSLIEKMAK